MLTTKITIIFKSTLSVIFSHFLSYINISFLGRASELYFDMAGLSPTQNLSFSSRVGIEAMAHFSGSVILAL